MKSTRFLLVEDSPDHSETGERALEYVRREGENLDQSRPDAVSFDLDLLGISGLDVLIAVKNGISLRSIPVIVLTTSDVDRDRLEWHNYHMNSFVTKPMGFDKFREVISEIEQYWVDVNVSPSK